MKIRKLFYNNLTEYKFKILHTKFEKLVKLVLGKYSKST